MDKIKTALSEKREISFEVSHPQRSYAGYTVYRLQLKINVLPPDIIHYHFIGWKRYNDFKKLHKDLKSVFPEVIRAGFPVFPKGKIFGRFEESVIEERREISSNFLQLILSKHEMLFHQHFQNFISNNESMDKDKEIDDVSSSMSYNSIVDELVVLPNNLEDNSTIDGSTGETEDNVFTVEDAEDLSIENSIDNRQTWLREARSICESDIDDLELPSSEEPSVLLDEPLINDSSLSPDGAETADCSGDEELAEAENTNGCIPSNSERDCILDPKGIPDFNQQFNFDDKMSQKIEETVQQDDYVYQASVAMGNAIEQEALGNFDAAFDMYKFGVGLLLRGVQSEENVKKREAVRRKTAQYLMRAEQLYISSLKNSGEEKKARMLPAVGDSKWRFRLSDVKVFGIIKNVMLVQKGPLNDVYVMKVLHKKGAEYKSSFHSNKKTKNERNLYNCRFMTKLISCVETQTGVYLLLEYVAGGRLWDYLNLPLFPCGYFRQSGLDCCSTGNVDINGNHSDIIDSQYKTGSYEKSRSRGSSITCRLKRTISISNGFEEDYVRVWAAQIALGLMALHTLGIICRDLNPKNILMDSQGNIKLTYFSNVDGIDYSLNPDAVANLYTSPEVEQVSEISNATDWWSYGALVFELLMGQSLHSCHPNGINRSSVITLPKRVSNEACSLLASFLQYNPRDRLGCGPHGSEEIKSHPFFASIEWENLNM